MPELRLHEPLVFAPFFRPQVWGGRRLAEAFGKPLPPEGPIGESWELSVQPLHVSQVSEGPWAGTTLQQLWDERRGELLGAANSALPQFPWLIKWLDCRELLSVQVHPDDRTAQELLGEPFGKTESWVVVQADPTARIYAGLLPGVTREELSARSGDGTVAECLHSFVPHPGDCLHIPAGTVHAVGGGVLLAEVQQTSDATFRLFDWNRVDAQGNPRPLHLESALAAIDFSRGPVAPVVPQKSDSQQPEMLVRCPYYTLERIRLGGPWGIVLATLSAWMVLEGTARLRTSDGHYERVCRAGDVVLVPASVGSLEWQPIEGTPTLLAVTLP
jgi:mannose-6-phosphate isomerase